jgi:hypothetical protein
MASWAMSRIGNNLDDDFELVLSSLLTRRSRNIATQ